MRNRTLFLFLLIFILLLSIPASVLGQSSSTAFRFRTGSTLPTTCRVGDVFYKTGASAGQYNCTSTDTWTMAAGGGGASLTGSGTINTIPKWTSSSALGNSLLTDDGTFVSNTGSKFRQFASGSSTLFFDLSNTLNGSSGSQFNIAVTHNRPGASTAALAGLGAGNVDNGTHSYKVTYTTAGGETDAGTASNIVTVADKTTNGRVALTGVPRGNGNVTSRKIYRTVAGNTGNYKLVGSIADNTTTTFADNIADSSLGADAPTTNSTIDNSFLLNSSGLTIPNNTSVRLNDTTGVVVGSFTVTTANNFQIQNTHASGNTQILAAAGNSVQFGVGSSTTWNLNSSNNLAPTTDNNNDIGAQATRVRSLFLSGGVTAGIVTKTSNYTVTVNDYTILCDATSGAVTITLLAAASHTGRIYNMKKIDSGGNACTLQGNGAETIDGSNTKSTTTQYTNFKIQSNGTSWFVL